MGPAAFSALTTAPRPTDGAGASAVHLNGPGAYSGSRPFPLPGRMAFLSASILL